ncbi:MAG: hypothetical protein WCO27_04670 [Actinomycetes bacterium]
MKKLGIGSIVVSALLLVSLSPATGAPSKAERLPIPITLPVAQTGTITFANAEANFAAIPEAAWQRTQDVIAANPAVNIPTVINIGPNTKASKTAITDGLDRINKLFAGFRHVSAYAGIVYNAKDLNWAQGATAAYLKQLKVSGGSASAESTKRSSEAGCEIQGGKAINCYGGMSWDLRDTKSQAGGSWYGVETVVVDGKPLDFWTDENKKSGAMTQVTHEATHNYQITQFFYTPLGKGQNRSNDLSRAFVPWWFGEGHANAIGTATFLDSFDAYSEARSQNITRNPGSRTKLPAFTAAALKTLLTSKGVASPENPNYALGYSIGYAAVEALVAIGGPQATLALYTLGAKGQKWETAFKNVYGITWDEGASVLSKVLAAEYAANPMSN